MSENPTKDMKANIERREFENFSIEAFSQGKVKLDPSKNEDRFVITPTTFAVIDGATAKTNFSFREMTSGQYAGFLVTEALRKADPGQVGNLLVESVSTYIAQAFERDGFLPILAETPDTRPTAVAVIARIKGNKLFIMQIGDVGLRINGQELHTNDLPIDSVIAKKRIDEINRLKSDNPQIAEAEALRLGRESILEDLKRQISDQQNNPDNALGYGAFDGRKIPYKYVKIFKRDLSQIQTLEIFSDGYFKVPNEPTIESWEEGFKDVERVDPGKIGEFPSTKGSTETSYTDDRTVLIYRRK